MKNAGRRRLEKAFALAAAVLVVSVVGPPVEPVAAIAPTTEGPRIDAPDFREVGRVPVPTSKPTTSIDAQESGWLVLNPARRRGYTIADGATGTVIQSFDLDTLETRQRIHIPNGGLPIPAGYVSGGDSASAGEVIHAVDPVAGRIYLPMAVGLEIPSHPDAKRPMTYVLVVDEAAFDRNPTRAFGTFTPPVLHQRLLAYPLMGLTVSRHAGAPGTPGKLVAAFSSRNSLTSVPLTNTPVPGAFDHTLVQWDPTGVAADGPPPTSPLVGHAPLVDPGAWDHVLRSCATSSLSAGASGDTFGLLKNYQWGLLARRDAVYLGCQSAPLSGAVVRVALDPLTGRPVDERVVSLGKPVVDVLVDEGAGRLFLESIGADGTTWWTFDAAAMRFTGSVVGTVAPAQRSAAGIDPGSGRLYTLRADSCVPRSGGGLQGGGMLPVRGGLQVTEAGLDPVPAPRNVVPDLAYHAVWRITVDPVTRRVFLRLGSATESFHRRYPECEQAKQEERPVELFWRVYEDRIPVASRPAGLDDAAFTTDVDEEAGRTQASYLGSGSGYGSRSLLIGGLDALTNGAATTLKSLCGRADREALAGSVGKVEASDQSVVAEAAALDADAGTQEVLGDPLSRCRPQAPWQPLPQASPQQPGPRNLDELNKCSVDVREGSLDQAKPGAPDENKDGCTDRDGANRYAARCLGASNASAPGFDDAEHKAPRDGFEANVSCEEKEEKAAGSATGSLEIADPRQADPVKVARSTSEVVVTRRLGKGVTVKADSLARGVEIPGVGTIGVVRAEATATATGRRNGASASFTRTICDVDVQGLVVRGCLGDERQQQAVVDALNRALGTRGTARLRHPDPALAKGTAHGYLAAVQRDRRELFADQSITRDRSLAVPALEIVFYQGEGGAWGAGRQVFHLAGVQASTSYGIACTYGKRVDGQCAAAGEEPAPAGFFDDLPPDPGEPLVTTVTETLPGADETALPLLDPVGLGREGTVTRLLRAIPRAVAEALRLLFNNPRELGLLAALWALLYAPCYLGDRRRAVRSVAARRLGGAM